MERPFGPSAGANRRHTCRRLASTIEYPQPLPRLSRCPRRHPSWPAPPRPSGVLASIPNLARVLLGAPADTPSASKRKGDVCADAKSDVGRGRGVGGATESDVGCTRRFRGRGRGSSIHVRPRLPSLLLAQPDAGNNRSGLDQQCSGSGRQSPKWSGQCGRESSCNRTEGGGPNAGSLRCNIRMRGGSSSFLQ